MAKKYNFELEGFHEAQEIKVYGIGNFASVSYKESTKNRGKGYDQYQIEIRSAMNPFENIEIYNNGERIEFVVTGPCELRDVLSAFNKLYELMIKKLIGS